MHKSTQQAMSISSLAVFPCGFLLDFRFCLFLLKWGCSGNEGLVSKLLTYKWA